MFRAAMPSRRKLVATTIKRAIGRISMPGMQPAKIDRILVVSDDSALQNILHRLFSLEGYEVDVETHNFIGVVALCQGPPSVVILDVADPGSSDCDLCRRIGSLIPDLPLVILAGGSELAYKY